MSVPLSTSTTSGAASASANAAARPQMQSRRVSLKLGPLGITYSTDQVLWTEAVATAAAALGADEARGAEKAPGTDAEPVDPVRGLPASGQEAGTGQEQQAQAQLAAETAGRSFHLELAEAWRKQIEQRAQDTRTYGPKGTVKSGGQPSASHSAEVEAPAGSPAGATPGASAAATASVSANSAYAVHGSAPPASRMRQAIGAYLACARNLGATRPMLTAVA